MLWFFLTPYFPIPMGCSQPYLGRIYVSLKDDTQAAREKIIAGIHGRMVKDYPGLSGFAVAVPWLLEDSSVRTIRGFSEVEYAFRDVESCPMPAIDSGGS